MCGFAGYINKENSISNFGILKSMTNTIAHRGPDDADYYIDGEISLGFRRLSIIDIDGGGQPLENEDSSMVLCFNGEIYNYKELQTDLISKGHVFKTETDSEVILHGYEEYGEYFLDMLRGMFAFVIWDKQKHEMFGARDFFGIKPLYYTNTNGAFIFGSEIKSFLPHPCFRKELNTKALENYLSFQYSTDDETFFRSVYKLPPSHYFIYKNGEIKTKRFWSSDLSPIEGKSHEYWVSEIDSAICDSVEAHKISDVEVGSFLSSGVDSSYITSISNVDKTFSVGFDEGELYDETGYAKSLSKEISVKNFSRTISPDEFWDNIETVQYYMDEPLADPSAIALYFVCNTASQYVKVALSGEGADELFGGYNIYKEPFSVNAYNKIPFFIRKSIGAFASLFPTKRGFNFLVRRGKAIEDRFIGNANIFSEKDRKSILKIKTDAKSPSGVVKPVYDRTKDRDVVTKMQSVDINYWLTGDILLKADKMSMANSLEVRVPFLDQYVMNVARNLPLKEKINEGSTKYALREAASKHLPKQCADKKKLGFPVPIRVWLREDKYYNIVKEEFTGEVAKEFFHTKKLMHLLDEHKCGKADNSRKIWTVLTFIIWYKRFFIKETNNFSEREITFGSNENVQEHCCIG